MSRNQSRKANVNSYKRELSLNLKAESVKEKISVLPRTFTSHKMFLKENLKRQLIASYEMQNDNDCYVKVDTAY